MDGVEGMGGVGGVDFYVGVFFGSRVGRDGLLRVVGIGWLVWGGWERGFGG